jgi:hypothetical protein
MTITYIDAKEFNNWFAKAKPGEPIIYYGGKSFIADCEKFPALEKLRDTIWNAGFEVSHVASEIKFVDRKTLCLVQRRVGPKPEGNKVGVFEYVAVKRGAQL